MHFSTVGTPRAVADVDHHHEPQHHHLHLQNPRPTVYGDAWIPQQHFPGRFLVSPRRRRAVGQTGWTPAAAVKTNEGKAKKSAELRPDYHPVRQTTPGKDYHLVRRTAPRRECYATRCTNNLEFFLGRCTGLVLQLLQLPLVLHRPGDRSNQARCFLEIVQCKAHFVAAAAAAAAEATPDLPQPMPCGMGLRGRTAVRASCLRLYLRPFLLVCSKTRRRLLKGMTAS